MKGQDNGMVNQQSNDEGMRELALFAGAGGGILGGKLLGWRTVCAVEWDAYAASVLVARQNDGCLEAFPVWDDVQTFDGRPWRGLVDVVSGGFPCTEIANCAAVHGKRLGLDGKQSGLWYEMRRIIGEVRPRFAFVENAAGLIGFGLDRILSDFHEMGYDAKWGVLGAHHLGAPHGRSRAWIVANPRSERVEGQKHSADISQNRSWWSVGAKDLLASHSPFDKEVFGESMLLGVDDGVADQLDKYKERLKAIGNGQVPAVAATAWRILSAK
jgi:DNA (cytosine-5)-methyltransferase 1